MGSPSSTSCADAWAVESARVCYLLVPPDTELTEIARKRLAALKEFSDLGAGFKIAALDLELRGAGNLLGGEQHGHINAVGFDMYVRMLEETVRELKGEEVPPEIHSTLNLGLDIRIPPEYIADEHQRLRAYKRIADARDAGGRATAIREELEDRYGPVPEAVGNLMRFSVLKSLARRSASRRSTGAQAGSTSSSTRNRRSIRRGCWRSSRTPKAHSSRPQACCGYPSMVRIRRRKC